MKKTIFIGLLLIIPCLLFATGSQEEGSAEQATVSVWGWRPQDATVWEQVEAALQAQGENIAIDFQSFPPTEYDSKMNLSLQGGSAADILYTRRLPGDRTQGLIDNGYIVPVDDLLDLSNIAQTTLNSISSKGKVWGVPFANQVIGVFYNTEIFADYNLSEPSTWDELVDIAKTLDSNGVTPFMVPGKEGWALAMHNAMIGVSLPGQDWIRNATMGDAKFDDPAFVDLLTRMNDLKQYYQDDFIANDTAEMSAGFAFGEAAMVFYGIWEVNNWKELNPDIKVGYFPVPPLRASTSPSVYVYMDGSYALNSDSEQQDAALKVLQFTATPAYGTIFVEDRGEITAVQGVTIPADNAILSEAYATANELAGEYLYWVGSPFTAGTPNVYTVLRERIQAMYLDEITPAQLAAEVQEGLEIWYGPYQ